MVFSLADMLPFTTKMDTLGFTFIMSSFLYYLFKKLLSLHHDSTMNKTGLLRLVHIAVAAPGYSASTMTSAIICISTTNQGRIASEENIHCR